MKNVQSFLFQLANPLARLHLSPEGAYYGHGVLANRNTKVR